MDDRANLLVVQRVVLCLGDAANGLAGLGRGEDAEPLLLLLDRGDGAVVRGGSRGGGC